MIKHKNNHDKMTQLSGDAGERRSDMVKGQHIRLAMLAAGVTNEEVVRDIAKQAGVFESDITSSWTRLQQAGLVRLGSDFHDQLTPEGQQFVSEATDAMRAAHVLVSGFAAQT